MKKLRDIRIKVFNAGWWFYILLTVLLLVILSVTTRSLSYDTRRMILLGVSILEYIILRIYKRSLKDIRDDYNFYNELPCYLCNQSTILCVIASLTGKETLMGYCLTVGVIGALMAIFMPDRYNRDQLLFSKQAFGFYGYHGLLIVTCIGFYATGLYQPDPKDALWGMVITFSLAALAHLINTYLRKSGLNPKANYVFTYEADNVLLEILWKVFPVKLFYMIPVLLVFGAVSYIALVLLP